MPSPKRSKKPSVPITKVPSVKELCELLGFQHASLKDTTFFMNTSHAWRKSFKTSSGLSGPELLQWNDPLVQLNLTEMSERFLEASNNGINNGLRFWSSSRSWNQDSDLILPDDRVRVIELLKQLFWKQNRYAVNNNQYAQKNSEVRDGSQEKTTPIPQSTHANKTSPPRASILNPSKPLKQPRSRISTAPEPASSAGSQSREPGATPNKSNISDKRVPKNDTREDIFDGPNDALFYDTWPECSEAVFASFMNANSSKETGEMHQKVSRGTEFRKRKGDNLDLTPRRTGRKRQAPSQNRDYISLDDIEELSSSSSSEGSSIAVTCDHCGAEIEGERYCCVQCSNYDLCIDCSKMGLDCGDVKHDWIKVGPKDAHASGRSTPQAQSNITDNVMNSSNPKYTAPVAPMMATSTSILHKTHSIGQPPSVEQGMAAEEPPTAGFAPAKINKLVLVNHSSLETESSHQPLSPPMAQDIIISAEVFAFPSSPSGKQSRVVDSSTPGTAPPKDSAQPEVTRKLNKASKSPSVTGPHIEKNSVAQPASHASPVEGRHGQSTEAESITSHRAGNSSRDPSAENVTTASKPRAKTQVPLWIITREPGYTEERWDEGRFQGTSLSFFIDELSKKTGRGNIEKLLLTLKIPTGTFKVTVLKDAEDSWQSARKKFVEKLKEAAVEARKRSNEVAEFEIFVEPCYEQKVTLDSGLDDDEVEFEF